jgi:ankyrin repeat protein
LEAGLNIEATNIWGETPLHYAAKFGREDFVLELLQRVANVDAIDIAGRTPLQAFLIESASTSESIPAVLSAGADIRARLVFATWRLGKMSYA